MISRYTLAERSHPSSTRVCLSSATSSSWSPVLELSNDTTTTLLNVALVPSLRFSRRERKTPGLGGGRCALSTAVHRELAFMNQAPMKASRRRRFAAHQPQMAGHDDFLQPQSIERHLRAQSGDRPVLNLAMLTAQGTTVPLRLLSNLRNRLCWEAQIA